MMDYQYQVPATVRTVRILELLATSPEGLTAGQLADALEIPHSALHALLNTLKGLDYVQQAGPRYPYHLGAGARVLQTPRPLGDAALIFAFQEEAARHAPEETLALAVLNGADVLILAEAPCAQTVRSVLPAGYRAAATEHPAGLALLAGLSESALARALPQMSGNQPPLLQDVRQQTLARRIQEETATLAVPICPDGQHPEAALILSIPAFRWSEGKEQRHIHTLREIAARISYRLGAITYLPYGVTQPHHLGNSIPLPAAELATFLNGPWAARLACIRPDGTPHIVTVWYEWDGATFLMIAWPGSAWAGYVAANPAVALTVAESWPPLRRVLARGKAHALALDAIPGGLDGLYRRLSVRYLGATAETASPVSYGAGWQAFRVAPDELEAEMETS